MRKPRIVSNRFAIRPLLLLSILLLVSCSPSDVDTGVVEDADRDRKISYQVWREPSFDGRRPLILLSHGSGGDVTNHAWLINALVTHGYIVAAPTHPGNAAGDNSDGGVVSVWERPADMRRLLDHLLDASGWSALIDAGRIGAAGFSSGGYTVLALGGARYDRELMRAYCRSDDHGPDCNLASAAAKVDYSRSNLSFKDDRIKAIFAMAPAVGPAITPTSLESFQAPVRIIASRDDELVYPQYHAARYARYIPGTELTLLESGGHFVFLECKLTTRVADWFIRELDLCGGLFDRSRTRARIAIAAAAVDFFDKHLALVPAESVRL